MTETQTPADPSDFAVEITRDAAGRVALIRVIDSRGQTHGEGVSIYDVMDEDEITHLIALARGEERGAPDTLPSDRGFILAALRDLGIPILGEEEWRDVALVVSVNDSDRFEATAGAFVDDNLFGQDDPDARPVIALARGEVDEARVGGGAAPLVVLTRRDAPAAGPSLPLPPPPGATLAFRDPDQRGIMWHYSGVTAGAMPWEAWEPVAFERTGNRSLGRYKDATDALRDLHMAMDCPRDITLPEGWTWQRVMEERARWGTAACMVPVATAPGCVAWGHVNFERNRTTAAKVAA